MLASCMSFGTFARLIGISTASVAWELADSIRRSPLRKSGYFGCSNDSSHAYMTDWMNILIFGYEPNGGAQLCDPWQLGWRIKQI